MRIEINLPQNIADIIKDKAETVNHSRKSFIEYLCIIVANNEKKSFADLINDIENGEYKQNKT